MWSPYESLTSGSRRLLAVLRETVIQWMDERAPRMAAALAFYTTFSLAPILIIALAISGLVFGHDAARGQIVAEIQGLIGVAGARAVQDLIESAHKPATGALATIVGIVTLLFGATGVVGELQDSLNTIWNVKARPKSSLWKIVKTRFTSFAMVLGVGFLLLVSLILSTILSSVTEYAGQYVSSMEPMLHIVDFVFSSTVIAALFRAALQVPSRCQAGMAGRLGRSGRRRVAVLGREVRARLLPRRSSLASTYGAAGSLVVLLLWVYYSAQILFFGAELTQVWTTSHRSVKPSAGAVKTVPTEPRKRLRDRFHVIRPG
jgi:membrane protein